jgi:predicted dehydrogenase
VKAPNVFSRRQFLKTAAAAIVPATLFGRNAPSNRINLAMIGTGNQGFQDMRAFLQEPDAQIVAVCDVNRGSGGYRNVDQFCGREPARQLVEQTYAERRRAGTFRGCDAYADFRDVLARPDVDAVVIVVPDHWHAIMTIMAAQAGKDIYCEKPLSYTIAEGRAMVTAAKRAGIVVQTGSHQRSNRLTRFGCELVRNGYIGQLKRIETAIGPWNRFGPTGAWSPMPVPDGFDYNMWLGPAPWAPYHKDRCLYTFRFMRDYSGGQVTNLGAHSFDMAQWGNNTEHTGPVEIEDAGSEWPTAGLFDVARIVRFRMRYANGVELECRTDTESDPDRTVTQCRFIGTEGWVEIGNQRFETHPASLKTVVIGPDQVHLGTSTNHMRDFLDCIKTRTEPIAPIEVGHRSATVCHLANIAMALRRKLRWDPAAEQFIGDAEANRFLRRANREPWQL